MPTTVIGITLRLEKITIGKRKMNRKITHVKILPAKTEILSLSASCSGKVCKLISSLAKTGLIITVNQTIMSKAYINVLSNFNPFIYVNIKKMEI